jgi:erythronate-4-phosphate dehydrogenase
MKIIADRSIPLVCEAFAEFGDVILMTGREITKATVADASALLIRSVTPVTNNLISDSALRFVASSTIGIEHVDLEALKKQQIHFAWAPGSNANSVAQYIVSTLLCLEKKTGKKLFGSTLGIIGVGNIGSRVNAYANALGMRCVLCDPPLKRLYNNEIYVLQDKVLELSDFITIHVPLEKNGPDPTVNLVNEQFLRKMKAGAILINTSRGGVVDESALKANRNKLGGLVLDVWTNEPRIDFDLVGMTDIATPHIAGYSFDGKINGIVMIHHAACDFFNINSTWDPSALLEAHCDEIDIRDSDEPLQRAVAHAYPILNDDFNLRNLSKNTADARSCGFDALRVNYAPRYEFSHFSVRCSSAQVKESRILARLGFKTVTRS